MLALSGMLAAEWLDAETVPPNPAAVVRATHTASAPVAEQDHGDDWAETALQRPVFNPDRRPKASPIVSGVAQESSVPRLTGVVVTPLLRRAMFSSAGPKPLTVEEGAVIAGWTVRSIAPGLVVLEGPLGRRELRPGVGGGGKKEPPTPAGPAQQKGEPANTDDPDDPPLPDVGPTTINTPLQRLPIGPPVPGQHP